MNGRATLTEAARELRHEGIAWYDALADLFDADPRVLACIDANRRSSTEHAVGELLRQWRQTGDSQVLDQAIAKLERHRAPRDAAAPSENHR
jgi:hypothetical protein